MYFNVVFISNLQMYFAHRLFEIDHHLLTLTSKGVSNFSLQCQRLVQYFTSKGPVRMGATVSFP